MEKVSPGSRDVLHCISAAAKAESCAEAETMNPPAGAVETMGCKKISCWSQHLC